MAKNNVLLAFVVFTIVGMAAATAPATPSTVPPVAGEDQPGEHPIGPVTGGPAADAAPVGGPVPENAFPNLAPAAGPASGAAVLEATVVAGAIGAAGVVGSFFF